MAFVVRERTGDLHRVVFPYAAWSSYLIFPTLMATYIASVLDRGVAYAVAALLWAAMLLIAAPMRSAFGEVKRRMRSGGVSTRGSRWSLANPLAYEWREGGATRVGDQASSSDPAQQRNAKRPRLTMLLLGIAGLGALLTVAGELGGAVGRSAAVRDLELGFRAVDQIRSHLDAVLRQVSERRSYSNPEGWAGDLPASDVPFRQYSAHQIRDYGYRQVHKMQLNGEPGVTGTDPYREMAFILGSWERTRD